MELAILLSLAASLCTATSSICQRLGARHLEQSGEMRGFDAWLVFRLARQPTWLLGFACMIAGFAFQVAALHFGPLALVQPIMAMELLFVFGYLALRSGGSRRTRWREWAAAVAMSVYALMAVGTRAMLLTSHAMAAGPLAASQPGFTIGDPVTAILLGAFVFKESLGTSPGALAAEVAGLVVLALGVWTLSRSALITHTTQPRRAASGEAISRELTRRSR
jgi:drug/metabolite transporter (DMT)-like permease